MLKDLRTHSFRATAVSGTTSSFRDELIACQHHTEDYGSSVSMDCDMVFDAMQDDSLSPDTRADLRSLLEHFPDTEMFTFNP